MDVTEIERRVDRAIAAPITVNAEIGGIALENMGQVMEFAKLMAVSGSAVPGYLRGNPGGCLAICSRALRWQMDPFAVAEKSYQVVNKGEERIAFEAQLVHAVITARAPLKTRLRHEILGEGDQRRCKVSGLFRGEERPHEYTSPTLKEMLDARPKRRDGGGYGGSPLWETVPEVQLAYSTVRQWCRLFASEVLLGVYTPDELDDGSIAVDMPISKVAAYAQKLRDAKAARAAGDRGFDVEHVATQAAARNSIIEGEVNSDVVKEEVKDEVVKGSGDEPVGEGRGDQSGAGADSGPDKGGSDDAVGGDPKDGEQSAGQSAAQQPEDQADIFPGDRKPKQEPSKGKRR